MAAYASQVLAELGADPSGFVGRELSADLIVGADLVLCAAREHRSAVVTFVPIAWRRTFTLREFARLLADVSREEITEGHPADRIRTLARVANRRRGFVSPVPPAQDDIKDPLGRQIGAFRECAQMTIDCLEVPLRLLADDGSATSNTSRPPMG
jgi:protein-tyrosine phosphatase